MKPICHLKLSLNQTKSSWMIRWSFYNLSTTAVICFPVRKLAVVRWFGRNHVDVWAKERTANLPACCWTASLKWRRWNKAIRGSSRPQRTVAYMYCSIMKQTSSCETIRENLFRARSNLRGLWMRGGSVHVWWVCFVWAQRHFFESGWSLAERGVYVKYPATFYSTSSNLLID